MFKHILLPTDGSEISSAMIRKCIAFALENNAKVTGVHVLPAHPDEDPELQGGEKNYRRDSEAHGQLCLLEITQSAREQGVPCDTMLLRHVRPYEAILMAAREQGCDLICMASHGRGGHQSRQVGSETLMVLLDSHIPVLVLR
ncbi:universal stress protein [Oxalobacteraceae bacterium]|nr:universal stress protein [Oxalobacteraceae bacterium]